MKWDPIESAKQYKGLRIRDGVYYWHEQIRGERHHKSLGVPVATKDHQRNALRVLKSMRDALLENRIQDYEAMGTKRVCSTIGELFEAYGEYAARRDLDKSWKGNPHALRNVVAVAKEIKRKAVDKLSLDVLTPALMLQYESKALAAATDRQKTSNTIVSRRRKVRALFAKKARLGYTHLEIPGSVDAFLLSGDVKEQVTNWKRPAPELVEATKAAARKLREDGEKPGIQAVYLLAYGLALRAKEVAACRWDWFEMHEGQRVCWVIKRPNFKPKGREGYVPVPDAVWEWLQELRRPGEDLIVPGISDYDRYHTLIECTFPEWFQSIGWKKGEGAHKLRRLRGCEWWEDPAVGPALCSEWLRHSSLLVTQRHYGKPKLPEQQVTIDL